MSRWSWFAEILEIKKSDEKSDEKCSQVQSERSKGVKVDDPLSWAEMDALKSKCTGIGLKVGGQKESKSTVHFYS